MRQMTLTQSGAPGVLLAGSIFHTSIQNMDFVEIFNVSLDLSTIHFAQFSECRASFVYSWYSCYSILEHYSLFSGVKLTIKSFCLFPYLSYRMTKSRVSEDLQAMAKNWKHEKGSTFEYFQHLRLLYSFWYQDINPPDRNPQRNLVIEE